MAFYIMNIHPLEDPTAMTRDVHKPIAGHCCPKNHSSSAPQTSWSSREKGDKPEDDLRVCVKFGSLRPAFILI